jgi:hypothetical protein
VMPIINLFETGLWWTAGSSDFLASRNCIRG